MSKLDIHSISKADTAYLDQVEVLWKDFYDGMAEQGLMLPLIQGGESIWRKSIEPSLGRVNQLLVIREDETVIGFALGTLRITQEFLGSKLVGFISGFYISPGHRNRGIGARLYQELEDWFISKKVHSFELQVLFENEEGRAFWNKVGFRNELFQMRKGLQD